MQKHSDSLFLLTRGPKPLEVMVINDHRIEVEVPDGQKIASAVTGNISAGCMTRLDRMNSKIFSIYPMNQALQLPSL